jgi:hypothetical protein
LKTIVTEEIMELVNGLVGDLLHWDRIRPGDYIEQRTGEIRKRLEELDEYMSAESDLRLEFIRNIAIRNANKKR